MIWESGSEKLLGALIDKNLKFDDHVSKLCTKVSRKVTMLSRISKYMILHKRRMLFKSFAESQFSYCPLVWMFHSRTSNAKINRVHLRALRLVYKDYTSTFDELLERDQSFSIHHRNIQLLAMELYKNKHDLSHEVIKGIFDQRNYTGKGLRSQIDFKRPNNNKVHHGGDSLRSLGPIIWNLIPNEIKSVKSFEKFKSLIKEWKPSDCPCRLCKTYVRGLGYVNLTD